ncbi:MAG: hypothetical protein A2623_00690 [Caulobacterales bacterium RIFCSPHIGHO2_01_FULL_70_19]|nr:MAG: hypothetical protein A2623_00690 [Caulobacterales bacterium RIFCSPHIGHO2_01_FULL_70_19]
MRRWPLRHVWISSALLGVVCAVAIIAVQVSVALALPGSEPAFRAGEATAPPDKAFVTVVRELVSSAVLVPWLETLLLFYLPHLAFRRLKGPAAAALFTALMAAIGWGLHGSDVYAIGHGLDFGMLGLWFWTVWATRDARRAILATTLAHSVWNGLLILAWVLWGRT